MNKKSLVVMGVFFMSACSVVRFGTVEHFQRDGLERAVFDLECPKDQIDIQVLGGGSFGVSGCGKKAVYVASGHKQFIRNSEL